MKDLIEQNKKIRNATTSLAMNIKKVSDFIDQKNQRIEELETGLENLRSQLIDGGLPECSPLASSITNLLNKKNDE